MTAMSVEHKVNGTPVAEPGFDAVALAKADAIRKQAEADAEAARIKAEGEAKAAAILAAEQAAQQRLENEKTALANERAALRFKREQAEQLAKIAEADRKREEAERLREEARRAAQEQDQAEAAKAEAVETSSKRWRRVAMGFYGLCAAVALPVQMAAFYDPNAAYLLVAPVFIELIALVALVGAAAAVTAGRPQLHYRLVAWAGALTAATINIVHGLEAFDPATAFGTALASIAGPGMWDLHEHGRTRKRDGKVSRRQRRKLAKAERAEAKAKAAEEERRQADKKAAEEAAAEAARKLAAMREGMFPDVWEHAVKLAAALGETAVTEAVWKRAHLDVRGAEPGEDADIIAGRLKAQKRVQAVSTNTPVAKVARDASSQRASHLPQPKKTRTYKPPVRAGRRTKGDAPKFSDIARRQASIAAKSAAREGD